MLDRFGTRSENAIDRNEFALVQARDVLFARLANSKTRRMSAQRTASSMSLNAWTLVLMRETRSPSGAASSLGGSSASDKTSQCHCAVRKVKINDPDCPERHSAARVFRRFAKYMGKMYTSVEV